MGSGVRYELRVVLVRVVVSVCQQGSTPEANRTVEAALELIREEVNLQVRRQPGRQAGLVPPSCVCRHTVGEPRRLQA